MSAIRSDVGKGRAGQGRLGVSGRARVGVSEMVTLKQRSEGGQGRSQAETGQARWI